jgi:5-methyltetrahydrofolate--homocysteine methyltransferase
MVMAKNEELFNAICKGQRKLVEEIVNKLVAAGGNVTEMLNESMIPAMRSMGDKFSRNEVYVPEMLIAARAMQAGLKIIEPILVAAGHKPLAKICIGTVKGDLHDIGKNLVAMMLKGAGYEVDDLGVDCDVAKFQAAVERGAQAVLCSALLTTTMPYMKTLADAMKGKPAKVIIGGAPVTQQYANEIGAAGYGADANDAVKVVDTLLGTRV